MNIKAYSRYVESFETLTVSHKYIRIIAFVSRYKSITDLQRGVRKLEPFLIVLYYVLDMLIMTQRL